MDVAALALSIVLSVQYLIGPARRQQYRRRRRLFVSTPTSCALRAASKPRFRV